MSTMTLHADYAEHYTSLNLTHDEAQRILGDFLGLRFDDEPFTIDAADLRARLAAAFATIGVLASGEQVERICTPLREVAEIASEARANDVPVTWA